MYSRMYRQKFPACAFASAQAAFRILFGMRIYAQVVTFSGANNQPLDRVACR